MDSVLPRSMPVDDEAAAGAREAAGGNAGGSLAVLAHWLGQVRGPDAGQPLDRLLVVQAEPAAFAGLPLPDQATTVSLRATDDVDQARADGIALADRCADSGIQLVVVAGGASAAEVLAALGLATTHGPAEVVDRGPVLDDQAWMRRVTQVRDAMRRLRPAAVDPSRLLEAAGDPAALRLAALLRQASARRTPVLLDPGLPYVAALLASREDRMAARWWLPASTSPDPADALSLARLPEQPAVDLRRRGGDGVAALLALAHCTAAAALIARGAGFDGGADAGTAATTEPEADRPQVWAGM